MGIPCAGCSAAVHDLNESHASLDQPPCRQQLHSERLRRALIQTVQLLSLLGLIVKANRLRHRCLHPERQLVRLQPRPQHCVIRVLTGGDAIQASDQVKFESLLLAGQIKFRLRIRQRIIRINFQGHGVVCGAQVMSVTYVEIPWSH